MTPANPDAELNARVIARALAVCALGFFWAALFWFSPAREWPGYGELYEASTALRRELGWHRSLFWAAKSWVFVLIPVLALWAMGRAPRALGLGRMATHGWRIVALGFGVSLPVLVWIGLQDEIQRYYAHMFRTDGWIPALSNLLVIAVEHVFIEGLVLALALPSGGLHNHPEAPRAGRLAWLGFGNTPGGRGVLDWVGVPAGAWPALIGSALLFGLVHAGKASAELWSAFPGGLGLAVLTYRIRSVWPSVLLHAGTGLIILLTAWLAR